MNICSFDSTLDIEKDGEAAPILTFNLGYRAELDGFRGISVILVFIHHLYHPLLPGGFLGVDMFFVLSGFLITSLLLEEWHQYDVISLKKFYVRRLLRLMPAIFFLILALMVYALFFLDEPSAAKTFQGIWLTLSYSSNWFYAFNIASADNPLGVTWSLAVEEQFYLIFPVLLCLALKYKFGYRQIIFVLVCFIAGIALHRKILVDNNAMTQRLYYSSDTRADALLIGCLVAFLFSQGSSLLKRFEGYFKIGAVISFAFLFFMVATATSSETILYSGGYTIVALSVSSILIGLVAYQPKLLIKILSFSPLVWVGRISYGLYLWHWTVRYFIYGDQLLPTYNLQLAIVVFLSFA